MRRYDRHSLTLLVAVAVSLAAVTVETKAHKVITSKYSYNADVFPIVREHCGRCHVEGGPAPMSLLAWNDGPDSATPWAESIRQSIVGEYMPPWYADPQGPAVKGGFALTATQSDKLLTWATGGTPEGDPALKPAKMPYQARWTGGNPDLKLQMDADYVMPEGETDTTKEFVIRTGLVEARWLKAVDLLPGAPEIVRNATISLENGPALAVWVPGDNLVFAPSGAGFRIPARANLRLQIHYKKQWQNERKTISDRSTIGLYFIPSPAAGQTIESFTIESSGSVLRARTRVLAVRPSLDRVYGAVTVQAIAPTGTKTPLLKLRVPRPEWARRYWLAQPVDLPAGTRIEVITASPSSYIDLSGARFMKAYPLEIALDVVRN
jgi:hypothetical protein